MSESFEPKIAAFVCNWCTYTGADLAGTSRLPYASNVRIIRLPCTGRISPLFILKALEQGADGVIVSGCHPGDCHYTAGNYHARRKYSVFRELLHFLGIEPERVTFSWVSAAEGKKWADLVNEVTATVRQLGPRPAAWGQPITDEDGSVAVPALKPPAPIRYEAPADQLAAQTEALREKARELLASGRVEVVIGYGEGTLPGSVRPVFITRPEDVDRLVWNERCHHNLGAYAAREITAHPGKVAMVVKGCDERSLIGLIQENSFAADDLVLIGMACHGMADAYGAVQGKCAACTARTPSLASEVIGEATPAPAETTPATDLVAQLDALTPAERWNFWQAQFQHCLKCYACRAACPLCSCDRCIVEKTQPRWIPPQADGPGNLSWNAVRAWHLAGRCVGCGACAQACPAGIPLHLLNLKMAQVVKEAFDYEPGRDPEATPPLTAYREDDKQEFIR
jgi:coenzyme F420-reducing hydrogenase delta subunit/ferredoxin